MRYNDVRRSKAGQNDILTGKEWYEIQAFRALNQVSRQVLLVINSNYSSKLLGKCSIMLHKRGSIRLQVAALIPDIASCVLVYK